MGEVFLDRYEVESEVGQGGMAVVYRGMDRVLHRPVAIKVLHPHLARKAEARARFAREARIIAKLRHPHIVEVYDFAGEDSDRAFLVQEFVDGEPLSEFLARHGPLLPEVAALVVATVARALQHAHERGVVHRDVKPENLMVRRDGVLKLMDFGIAHAVDMEHLTMTGAVVGSPAHMSPEQVDGRALDARTDVFSLGTLLFQAASGRLPFTSDTPAGLLRGIAEARLPDVRVLRAGFPDDLWAVLRHMMTRDAADRIQTAREVADALEGVVRDAGMPADAAELARCFADPEGRTAELRGLVGRTRRDRGRDLVRGGKLAAGIRELDVALVLMPGDEEARRWIARARRSARRRRVSRTSVMAAVAAGVVVGAVAAVLRIAGVGDSGPEEDAAPAAADAFVATEDATAATPEVLLAPAPQPSSVALLPKIGSRDGPGVHPLRPPATGAVPPTSARTRPGTVAGVPVTLVADPPAASIVVDGQAVGQGRVDLVLPAGSHRVLLTHPSCASCRDTARTLVLNGSQPPKDPIRYQIEYREATLVVHGPDGAEVAINGVVRGRTNQKIPIPMSQPKPATYSVSVRAEGQPPRTANVVLEPGKSSELVP